MSVLFNTFDTFSSALTFYGYIVSTTIYIFLNYFLLDIKHNDKITFKIHLTSNCFLFETSDSKGSTVMSIHVICWQTNVRPTLYKLNSVLLFFFIFNLMILTPISISPFLHIVYIHYDFKLHIVFRTTLERMWTFGKNRFKCFIIIFIFSSNESNKQWTDYNRHNFI